MFLKKSIVSILFILFFVPSTWAQNRDDWAINPIDSTSLNKLDYSKNELVNSNALFPLLAKLYKIKHFSKENAVFVHIGDSHIQADLMTSVIRTELQSYFGNAGRGLVFPYQVAKSNAPWDIISSSKSGWKGSRLAKIDTSITCGISGFGLQSQGFNPDFSLDLRSINGQRDTFDQVTFFMGGNVSELLLEYNDLIHDTTCFETPQSEITYNLQSVTSGFKLSFPTTAGIQFFGASLQKKDACGIIYHSIGANGARFIDYTKTPQFWNQLKSLHADCYIISLGTNEAQDPNLTAEGFLSEAKSMIEKLRLTSPEASIIITTPPVSYFKKVRPNQSLEVISDALKLFCANNNIVYWDLFNVSKGLEGARIWKTNQWLRADLVHFSREAYVLQGKLFVDAFSKVWNSFLCKYH